MEETLNLIKSNFDYFCEIMDIDKLLSSLKMSPLAVHLESHKHLVRNSFSLNN